MSAKPASKDKGPSWTDVILGAILSAVLGAVLGAVYLILKPVLPVKDIPKEPVAGAVYYMEGIHDSGKSRSASEKKSTFVGGGSVSLDEGELNSLAAPAAPAAQPTAPGAKPPPPPPSAHWMEPGPLNFRIRAGVFQIAAPVTLSVFGLEQKVIVQARGAFARHGDTVAFVPSDFYVGSCPIERFPFASGWVLSHILLPHPVPDDLAAAWSKATDASVDGSALRLTMP